MSKVAFLLLATPSELEATHQQTPPSCSFLFCIARKKKRDPSGRSILCELGSSGAILTGSPSLNHSIIGASGDPLARQSRVTGSFLTTVWFMGCCVITGLEAEKGISKLGLSLLTNCDAVEIQNRSPLFYFPKGVFLLNVSLQRVAFQAKFFMHQII